MSKIYDPAKLRVGIDYIKEKQSYLAFAIYQDGGDVDLSAFDYCDEEDSIEALVKCLDLMKKWLVESGLYGSD